MKLSLKVQGMLCNETKQAMYSASATLSLQDRRLATHLLCASLRSFHGGTLLDAIKDVNAFVSWLATTCFRTLVYLLRPGRAALAHRHSDGIQCKDAPAHCKI